jgi:hypothetical protein
MPLLLHVTDSVIASLLLQVGDETMSVLEIWGAEYQENDCLLIKPESRGLLEAICERERCLMQVRCFALCFCGCGFACFFVVQMLLLILCTLIGVGFW